MCPRPRIAEQSLAPRPSGAGEPRVERERLGRRREREDRHEPEQVHVVEDRAPELVRREEVKRGGEEHAERRPRMEPDAREERGGEMHGADARGSLEIERHPAQEPVQTHGRDEMLLRASGDAQRLAHFRSRCDDPGNDDPQQRHVERGDRPSLPPRRGTQRVSRMHRSAKIA